MQIHLLRLQRPGTAAALIPQRPEDGDENVNNGKAKESTNTFSTKHLLQESETSRWNVYKLLASGPKADRGNNHGNSGDTERPTRPKTWISQKERAEDGRNEGPGINGEIEPTKNFREQMLIRFTE